MQTALRIEDLTAGCNRSAVFCELNVEIVKGKIIMIIGPNGCGKSTLLKTIGRILRKEKGRIFLQEQDMQQLSTKEIAQRMAILSPSQ